MITPTQMRAARAMLDVSQGHVAEHLGIAANTLSKIESGQSDISVSRNTEIERFYEREGIAFTENDGVKWESGGVKTFQGQDGFFGFMDDVYNTVKDTGGEIFVNNVNEQEFLKWGAEQAAKQIERMEQVQNVHTSILVLEGDGAKVDASYITYKEVAKEDFGNVPFYIYGNKTAFIVFSDNDVEIFVISQSEVTKFFKNIFLETWNKAI